MTLPCKPYREEQVGSAKAKQPSLKLQCMSSSFNVLARKLNGMLFLNYDLMSSIR